MRSDVLFAATPLSQRHFKNIFKKDSIYLPENGILKMERSEPIHWDGTGQLELIWVGAIFYRKALCIMLDSLALMSDTDRAKIHLNVVGNGALKEKMKRFVDEKKLPVTFYGSLSKSRSTKGFHEITFACHHINWRRNYNCIVGSHVKGYSDFNLRSLWHGWRCLSKMLYKDSHKQLQ